MPNDLIIHSYKGSSTEEKRRVLTKDPSSEHKGVIIQNGNFFFLKGKVENLILDEI